LVRFFNFVLLLISHFKALLLPGPRCKAATSDVCGVAGQKDDRLCECSGSCIPLWQLQAFSSWKVFTGGSGTVCGLVLAIGVGADFRASSQFMAV